MFKSIILLVASAALLVSAAPQKANVLNHIFGDRGQPDNVGFGDAIMQIPLRNTANIDPAPSTDILNLN